MQQSHPTVKRLYLAVLLIPSHYGIPAADSPAQGVFVPICRQGVSTAQR